MLRSSILGLGAYAAVCMMAGSASAEDINLHCSNGLDLRISSTDFTVNGEKRQFDWIDLKDSTWLKRFPISQAAPFMPTPDSGKDTELRLRWRVQANASAPQAYFLLDLSKDVLDVINGRGHESDHLHFRCTNLSRKLAV
jgi:hypothetical protein